MDMPPFSDQQTFLLNKNYAIMVIRFGLHDLIVMVQHYTFTIRMQTVTSDPSSICTSIPTI